MSIEILKYIDKDYQRAKVGQLKVAPYFDADTSLIPYQLQQLLHLEYFSMDNRV